MIMYVINFNVRAISHNTYVQTVGTILNSFLRIIKHTGFLFSSNIHVLILKYHSCIFLMMNRDWDNYESGFGNPDGNFWIGLKHLHNLVLDALTELHVHLQAFNNETRYARYSSFSIADHSDKYRLSVSSYSGNAGDSLRIHDQMQFTTRDSDNDIYPDNCAIMFEGAWWYSECHEANLNGRYYNEPMQSFGHGINWLTFRGHEESLKHVVMKIRRL